MADEFEYESAAARHERLLDRIRFVRDGINKDVIDYYVRNPENEDEQREKREGIRKYLLIASEQIDDLLRNWL